MIIKKFMDCKAHIWHHESYACTIVYDGRNKAIHSEGVYYAECDLTGDKMVLTEKNCEQVLNDMYYNYCVERASSMVML